MRMSLYAQPRKGRSFLDDAIQRSRSGASTALVEEKKKSLVNRNSRKLQGAIFMTDNDDFKSGSREAALFPSTHRGAAVRRSRAATRLSFMRT